MASICDDKQGNQDLGPGVCGEGRSAWPVVISPPSQLSGVCTFWTPFAPSRPTFHAHSGKFRRQPDRSVSVALRASQVGAWLSGLTRCFAGVSQPLTHAQGGFVGTSLTATCRVPTVGSGLHWASRGARDPGWYAEPGTDRFADVRDVMLKARVKNFKTLFWHLLPFSFGTLGTPSSG